MVEVKEQTLSLESCFSELQKIENKIELLETLRAIKGNTVKATRLKDVLVKGGRINNDALLNAIVGVDEHTEKLRELYKAKTAYENYMLNEIDRSKLYQPTIAIVFLKDILKVEDENGVKTKRLNWREVADIVNYSERQCQNYYYDYKNKKKAEKTALNSKKR